MNLRDALSAVAVLGLVLTGANIATNHLVQTSVPRQRLRALDESPPTIDVLAIGNSLVEADISPERVEARLRTTHTRARVANAGLGASGIVEHFLILRHARKHLRFRTMVYGFFDHQMAEDFVRSNAEIIGNHNVLYYLEPEVALRLLPFGWWDRLLFAVCRRSALLSERSVMWSKVERMRRSMDELGMPAKSTDAFGRTADFTTLEAGSSRAFVLRSEAILRSGILLAEPVRDLFSTAAEAGARIVVVEMPMHPSHLRTYYSQPVWREYRARTREAVLRSGATYLNASDWVSDSNLFADNLHLTKHGAQFFSDRLGAYLTQIQDSVPTP